MTISPNANSNCQQAWLPSIRTSVVIRSWQERRKLSDGPRNRPQNQKERLTIKIAFQPMTLSITNRNLLNSTAPFKPHKSQMVLRLSPIHF
jgi:hypothetical protein